MTTSTKSKSTDVTQAKAQAIRGKAQAVREMRELTAGDRTRIRMGKAGTKALSLMVRGISMVAVLMVSYLVAFFMAVKLVPNLMAAVQQGTGVTTSMSIDVVLAGWVVPSVFLVACLFAVLVLAVRWLLKQRRTLLARMDASLFRLDNEDNK